MEPNHATDRCDSCQRDDADEQATVFCLQCNERLCDQCNKHHKMNKASSNHKTQSITDVKDVEALSTLRRLTQCFVHPAKTIKYLCKDHDQLCCNECAIVRHRKCECVVSLADEMQKDANEASQSMEGVLKELSNHADMLSLHEETDQLELDSTQEICAKALATLKKNMEGAYKAIENELTNKAKMGRDEITRTISDQKMEIQKYKRNLNISIHKLATVRRVGQDVHLYLSERELRLEVEAFKKKLKDLREHANNKKLIIEKKYSQNALEACFKNFVEVHVKTVTPSLPDCTVKGVRVACPEKRVELPLQLIKKNISIYEKQLFHTIRANIGGCIWLQNFLVVLRNKTDIVLVDISGHPSLIETGLHYDYQTVFTKVDDRTLAIANDNCRRVTIMMLDATRRVLERTSQFSVQRNIIGMAYDASIQALVVLSDSGTVEFLNLEGREVGTFTLHNMGHVSGLPRYTMFDSNSKILYSVGNSFLIATTMESVTVFEYKLTGSLVTSPALDVNGNIFIPVSSKEKSVIQQLSRKGELIRTIEVSACALNYIMICFNTKMDRFIVLCDDKGKELKFFDMV